MKTEIFIKIKNCNVDGVNSIKRVESLRKMFFSPGKINSSTIPILRNINFNCKDGDKIALIGENGCGKSSVLKMISGIYPPNQGEITINGKIASIIEMGLGIEPEFSGRENIKIIMLYNNMLNIYNKELEQRIIDFSELGDKIDQPVKTYSSGMISRLAFSSCIFQEPDILLLDEVFSAGDKNFVEKSFKFMKNKIKNIPITILVSHQSKIVEEFCNRCILLKNGSIVQDGKMSDIMKIYNSGNY